MEWRGEHNCHAYEIDDTHYYDFFSEKVKQKIETPLDKLGLVDRHSLVGQIIADAPPGFNWRDKPRDHHWQWEESDYPSTDIEGEPNEALFRDLLINRTILPVIFERRIHKVSLKPEKPSKEVMSVMIEYGTVAYDLFESARDIVKWQRDYRNHRIYLGESLTTEKKKAHKKTTQPIGRRYSKRFCTTWQQFQEVPPEYRLADTEGKPESVLANLGHLVGRRTLDLRSLQAA